jgi:hypothetical protein
MSVHRYANRRHRLATMVAQFRATLALPKPRTRAAAATVRKNRLRLAEAEADMTPAPRRRAPSPPISPEACTTLTVGGSLFDRAPTVHAADGGAPATSTAARRMNARPTRRQVAAMLRRVDAAARG